MRSFKLALFLTLTGCTSELIRPHDRMEIPVSFLNPAIGAGVLNQVGEHQSVVFPDPTRYFSLYVSSVLHFSMDAADNENKQGPFNNDTWNMRIVAIEVADSNHMAYGLDPVTGEYPVPADYFIDLWPIWEVTKTSSTGIKAGQFYAGGVVTY